MLRYLLNAAQQVPALSARIAKLHDQPLKNKTMTLADHLREEGKIEGRREGIAEGRLCALRGVVLRTLEIRHGDYPEEIREVIETINDPATLKRLLDIAIRSNSVEEFARNL